MNVQHFGLNVYVGQCKTSIATADPTTSKGEVQEHNYYDCKINALEKLYTAQFLQGWSTSLGHFANKAFPLMTIVLPKNKVDQQTFQSGQFSICTVNFCNLLHKDVMDRCNTSEINDILNKHVLPLIDNDETEQQNRARYIIDFHERFHIGSVMSVGYQFVPLSTTEKEYKEELHVYFVLW